MVKFLVSTFLLLLVTNFGCGRRITPASSASVKNINQQFLQVESQANGLNKNHGLPNTAPIAAKAKEPSIVQSIPQVTPVKAPSGHVINKPTETNKPTAVKPSSGTNDNQQAAANVANKSSPDTNFPPLPSSNQGQSNVKQLVQYYNGRDQAAQSGAGPYKYSAVVAGTHKNKK